MTTFAVSYEKNEPAEDHFHPDPEPLTAVETRSSSSKRPDTPNNRANYWVEIAHKNAIKKGMP